jgi:uncharacterized membrane protein YfcA
MFFEHIPHLNYIWLVVASTIAGVMNAMAGGGSFLSFPAMLGMGVLPVQANATNTVALWPGQVTSVATLRGDVRRDLLPTVAITSVLGGICGAEVLLHTAQQTFMHLIPWLILVGTVIFGISGRVSKWIRRRAERTDVEPYIPRFALACALFPVCFYIGYFGAGAGFLVMTILALFGMEEMHALNALKVVAAMLSNMCAIITFIFQGAIVWHYCLVSMVFAAFGGWMGARWARRVNGDVLRAIVVGTGIVIAGYFFWKQAQG